MEAGKERGASGRRPRMICAAVAAAVILITAALCVFAGRTRPLGELLDFDLSLTDGCVLERNFDPDDSYQMRPEEAAAVMDRVAALPARYVGPDAGAPEQEGGGFDLLLSSRDYGMVLLLFYEDGTVKAGTERFTRYAIGPADYQTLRQLVEPGQAPDSK